ncbi:hypothetical protein [Hymenobacter lapidiphilus]|uniref:Uncharacterized protein n=1 Tax=Hymenobacter lapidiphilus TaxID=2608003 RepID=A0A7Y7U730_9BACT|nr:hypothetical protein [Hymenobacter lapidiphilus]NVO32085.1 hypothetical protein [Hymenobacter lapidiphilus]
MLYALCLCGLVSCTAARVKGDMYVFEANRTSRIPVSLTHLQNEYYLKTIYLRQKRFDRLQHLLATQRVARPDKDRYDLNARMYLVFVYRGDTTEIAVDRGATVCYDWQCYQIDRDAARWISRLFTAKEKKRYVPIAFSMLPK